MFRKKKEEEKKRNERKKKVLFSLNKSLFALIWLLDGFDDGSGLRGNPWFGQVDNLSCRIPFLAQGILNAPLILLPKEKRKRKRKRRNQTKLLAPTFGKKTEGKRAYFDVKGKGTFSTVNLASVFIVFSLIITSFKCLSWRGS